ncbi:MULTISPECIES: VOC family protein [unclassified Nocardiopsis]|uniref:VOC family protein n=1 Tax=Nocardiopsis TaxID=2013 RepID=UPI00387B9ADD
MDTKPAAPQGSATVDPFIMADRAPELIDFIVDVFGARNVHEARTLDSDGLVLHAELRLGDSLITVADRKPDWPFTPSLLRVYVDDVEATLTRAKARGGRVVTEATAFFGDVFSRFVDPQGNLWWVYSHTPQEETAWEDTGDGGEDWTSFTGPGLEYIHATLLEAMRSLRDPRTSGN